MATPDFDQQFAEIYGWGNEFTPFLNYFAIAGNILIGTNPPYTVTDFLAFYPKFGGTPVVQTASLTTGSAAVTLTNVTGVKVGQFIVGTGIPSGTTIATLSGNDATLSQNATITGSSSLSIYVAPLVPTVVLQAYVALAMNSIMQVRWCEMWPVAMGWFVAHYCTLYLQTDAIGAGTPAAQAAQSGMAIILTTAETAGDVSYSGSAIEFDGWGTFGLTAYGQELATIARVIGSGNMLLW